MRVFHSLVALSFLLSGAVSAQSLSQYTEDNCLDGQDMSAEDVDISKCPVLPNRPNKAKIHLPNGETETVYLGAWELGQTVLGDAYAFGRLTDASESPRSLRYRSVSAEVDETNLTCWAKGYYRLRQMLKNPPAEYLALREAGFQTSFFQFQTDFRVGWNGFDEISSYRDHLIKWVTVIDEEGNCIQPTYDKFKAYAAAELSYRDIEFVEPVEYDEDNCLEGQDMNAADVDISNCPALPNLPNSAQMDTGNGQTRSVNLGAWELGMTSTGDAYAYGSLSTATDGTRQLQYPDGPADVNQENLDCWAKGYYRLRQMLKNPPEEYQKLRAAGYQVRFFQFQTDYRNGHIGFDRISSYMDHLVKWVTVIERDGTCVQPTYDKFQSYAARELRRRGID